MSFISFNLNYYKDKIAYYENGVLDERDIYEAKQLLKLIDDLADEGYYTLLDALQKECDGVDRLKAVVRNAGEVPFAVIAGDKSSDRFKNEKIEFTKYIENLISRAKEQTAYTYNGFLTEIKRFCESIKYDKTCAYVFLLRDTLLPYIYFKDKSAEKIYPYIISRGFLNLFYKEGVDDIVRGAVFKALENGYNDFESYRRFCKKEILNSLSAYPKVINAIKGLLSEIKSEKIVVVETGCYGTFPLLLSALDERVEFKMYTTVPYLFDTYKNHIYTAEYEKIRIFETIYCHDKLFKLVDFKDNKFYVAENENSVIIEKALREIRCFIQ